MKKEQKANCGWWAPSNNLRMTLSFPTFSHMGGAAIAEVYRRVRFSFSVFNAFAAKSTKDPRNFDINSSLKFQGRQLWRWAIFSGHFVRTFVLRPRCRTA